MKSLLVFTFVDFWTAGSGHRTRIGSLIAYLQDKVRITVYYARTITSEDNTAIKQRFSAIRVQSAEAPTYGEYVNKFKDYIENKEFDFALVEYIELSGVLEYLPKKTITFLDTHDLVADRISSFETMGLTYDGIELTSEEEQSIFGCYDYIIMIQQNELKSTAKKIDTTRLLLAPHPVRYKKKAQRKEVQNIGFIASPYAPNIHALDWFLREVWTPGYPEHAPTPAHQDHTPTPGSPAHPPTLHIYGKIADVFPHTNYRNVVFHGFVPDLEEAYDDCDIMINPVQCGAGLKIKNVEALGHGLPLVTTTHGASGMETGKTNCFLTADDPEDFRSALDRLITDHALRMELSQNAYTYAQKHFSEEQCYGGLTRLIT
jgi:hypothetical protein